MTTLLFLGILNTYQSITPANYAFLILTSSIVAAFLLFNVYLVSWLSLVLIIIFSSGIMTLFIYVASLSPNENSNNNRLTPLWLITASLCLNPIETSINQGKPSINIFSHQFLLIIITIILIVTILSISLLSFNPQQSMSSTF